MKIEQLSPENVLNQLESRQVELKGLLRTKQNELSRAPEGSLRTSVSHNRPQFYLADPNKKRHYIRKHNVDFIKQLAQKEYDKKIVPEISNEIEEINELIRQQKKDKIGKVYSTLHSAKKSYVQPVTLTSSEYMKKWLSINYKAKKIGIDSRLIPTSLGFQVRSKSEMIIAECLARENIPFRYEYPVKFKKQTVYPDFYCLNLRTRKEIIWEHFGLMDNAEYSSTACKKINAYVENNFFLGDKLIFTMETLDSPLDLNIVNKFIKRYLT